MEWVNPSKSQRTPRIAGNYQKLEESHGTDPSSKPPNGTNPDSALISKLEKNTILWFQMLQFVVLCSRIPMKHIYVLVVALIIKFIIRVPTLFS